MVRLEEIQDEAIGRRTAAFEDEDEDAWENETGSDISSDEDSDDDFDVKDRSLVIPRESVFERIAALKDIVPPSTRRSLSNTFSTVYAYGAFGGRLAGKLAWVVTTSALLVGLPYALAVETEAAVVQQERDFAQQQSGAQMLGGAPGAPAQGGPGQPQQQGQQPAGIRPPGF
ncbi:unnamed protein product [Parajaminaea phylloscopi]